MVSPSLPAILQISSSSLRSYAVPVGLQGLFIMTALGYLVMVLSIGKKVTFASLFSIYALCSGVALLVAWIPYFVIFTEPWKWYLFGTGLKNSCGMKLKEVTLIIGLSLTIWILFFWSLIPIIGR